MIICEEKWKQVGDLYEISNFGKIKSKSKSNNRKNGTYLTPTSCSKGAVGVSLYDKKRKRKSYIVSRLVAEAFLPDWNPKLLVDHIDGNKSNNHVSNLRMLTNRQNTMAHRKNRKGSTSQYRGVNWCNRESKWHVQISDNGKKKFLGYFVDEREAAKHWDKHAIANDYLPEALNFPILHPTQSRQW